MRDVSAQGFSYQVRPSAVFTLCDKINLLQHRRRQCDQYFLRHLWIYPLIDWGREWWCLYVDSVFGVASFADCVVVLLPTGRLLCVFCGKLTSLLKISRGCEKSTIAHETPGGEHGSISCRIRRAGGSPDVDDCEILSHFYSFIVVRALQPLSRRKVRREHGHTCV